MTNKDLKRMNRRELLELLLVQAEENAKLKSQLKEASAKLSERKVIIDKAGSIAEASLQLSGIFRSAEKAAQIYLDNVKEIEGRRHEILNSAMKDAQKKAYALVLEANNYSKKVRAEADNYYSEMQKKAQALQGADAVPTEFNLSYEEE